MGLISTHHNFGLKEGDQLIQCKGFVFNQSISSMGPHTPKKVTVIKEYDRFILVEAYFGDFYNPYYGKVIAHKYRECINKGAFYAGNMYFKKFDER